jgi:uncharacterized LabA/DUF88 family protein
MRVAIFFDGKNFYGGWQDQTGGRPIDFVELNQWLVKKVGGTSLWGAYYYTGISTEGENEVGARLENFLTSLATKPGFFVRAFPRRRRATRCFTCQAENFYSEEKKVDTSMVADMVRLAAIDSYDVAILLSGDSDYAPALEAVRQLGKQAYVATWGRFGLSSDLRRVCFDHIDLMDSLDQATAAPVEDDAVALGVFLEETGRAEKQFAGGYVGVNFFVTKWRSDRLDPSVSVRQRLLNRLVEDGYIEIYETPNGEKAMRSSGVVQEEALPDGGEAEVAEVIDASKDEEAEE